MTNKVHILADEEGKKKKEKGKKKPKEVFTLLAVSSVQRVNCR